jgi:isocitrate dehydrogenase
MGKKAEPRRAKKAGPVLETRKVLFAKGDGIGPEIVAAAMQVVDAAVKKAYGGRTRIMWEEVTLGEQALKKFGNVVPKNVVQRIDSVGILLKGPMTTPVGTGYRSPNVQLRLALDLYSNMRPVRYIKGIESPLRHPENVDLVIFRENTDDLYTGIEWAYDSIAAAEFRNVLHEKFGVSVPGDSGIGVKPMSKHKSERIARAAIEYAIRKKRRSVTIMHKGNIMKFTEGAFREWAYGVITKEYRERVVTEAEVDEKFKGKVPEGKILVNDRIADNMFQQIISRPEDYDVILAPNVDGDFISDAAGALIGNIGILGSASTGSDCGIFEATHGTAPKYAGKNVANPTGIINAAALMLDYMGLDDAAKKIDTAVERAVMKKKVTQDIARFMKVKPLGTKEFASELVRIIG